METPSYARFTPHRLSFEEARDAWLFAAGRLNLRVGGRPESLFASSNTRRTLYALVDRENVPAVMRTFDFANPDLSIPQRTETTVPQQALFGLNHPFVVQQAKALVKRISSGGSDEDRVDRLYQILFQRGPSKEERTSALDFVSVEEEPILAQSDLAKAWQHGVGEWDEKTGRIQSFTPLPHFTGHAWQGAEDWPNTQFGWAQLTAEGGHPGNSRKHAVVRRWTAPSEGSYDLRSILIHQPEVGDGIRAFVSHSRLGKLMNAQLHGSQSEMNLAGLQFRAGETLDFVVDIGAGLNSDQFLWSPQISASTSSAGSGGDSIREIWDARKDFSAQLKSTLSPWEQLAQVLMLSNEFMFVD